MKPALREGHPAQFDVMLDGNLVATRSKKFWERLFGGGWPEPEQVIASLRAAGA